MNYSPFIYAFEQEDIAITGPGTVDGRPTTHWWDWTRNAAEPELAARHPREPVADGFR
jgi:hypothetical protein